MAGVHFAKTLSGWAEEPAYAVVGATAVKAGDPIKAGATANVVIPMTAAADSIRGVADEAAAVGATCSYMRATIWNVFIFPCSAAKKFVASADTMTLCDFDTFTSGAMSIDPATDVSHDVLMISLADDELDDTVANKVLGLFNLRAWD